MILNRFACQGICPDIYILMLKKETMNRSPQRKEKKDKGTLIKMTFLFRHLKNTIFNI
jgi:hypothetical protein